MGLKKKSLKWLISVLLLVVSMGCSDSTSKRMGFELSGDLGVHDPVMIKEEKLWHIYYTGVGIKHKISSDGVNWKDSESVFYQKPEWLSTYVPRVRESMWAPDIVYYNDYYYLTYSSSMFGKNTSVIGMARNKTLNPDAVEYKWKDQGPIIWSKGDDDYNCIDSNIVLDDQGKPWLSFGSSFSGIKLVALDRNTLKPVENAEVFAIAARPVGEVIEAPYIVAHEGFYYLFVSFDFCCRKTESTYKIKVGRSKNITGPYADKEGKPMMNGGGTLIDAGNERWKGPGHCAVYVYDKKTFLVNHAYDAENTGTATLQIRRLSWDDGGWPTIATEIP